MNYNYSGFTFEPRKRHSYMKLITVLMLLPWFLSGQNGVAAGESSDPAAMEILASIKEDFDKYNSHLIQFEFTIEFPGEPSQVEEGILLQSNEKFKLDIGNRQIISDNETVWLYLKEDNEVQINDADFGDDGEYMSPDKIFKLYKSDEFIFAIFQNGYEDGMAVTQIECKPVDPDSEYAKMRLTVQDKNNKVKRFKIFSKDGSRFTMVLKEHKKNVQLDDREFSFNPVDYPGVIVEDLRF